MKKFNSDLVLNPSFNSITELTNTTFNPTNYVENRMATEQQISELYNRIVENEIRRDKCCRNIIVWEAHTQIVRMNTNATNSNGLLTSGGSVISTFDENVSIDVFRQGLSYTVTFPLKWSDDLYVKRNTAAITVTNCAMNTSIEPFVLGYRLVENDIIWIGNCNATSNNYARFWYGGGASITTSLNNDHMGHKINPGNNWGSFVYDVKDDGTVTITDHRRNTNFTIIRYYTQWILRRCADGSIIPDPE